MPPPTVVDEWLAGRRFGIVIDAGSSGSRLQIYSWRDARVVRSEEGPKSYRSLPKVEKGTQDAEEWMHKVEPGISSFGEKPEEVADYLRPLLEHARAQIPPSLQNETPIFLLATAGMRLLPSPQKTAVLDAACDFIKSQYQFRVEGPTSAGRCGRSIRVITGEEEGLFGWIAINFLMDQFTINDSDQTTFGFLDMGGASTQIAFEPSVEDRKNSKDLVDVRLRLIGGEEIHHQVFVTTWLGYGTNQARERYVGDAVSQHEASGNSEALGPVPDPCLPRDLTLTENVALPGHRDDQSRTNQTLIGSGSFEECLKRISPLLNKDAPCPDVPCLFNGVHVPHIDFSVTHFIGVSEYWYSSEHVFGLGGPYNFVEFERAASDFCSREWGDILRQHELSKEKGALGGDGEVEEEGRIVGLGKWGDKVEVSRLKMQCFKSAWLVNVLHDGIGMPRIVDPGGNMTGNPNEVKDKADQKGLGKPIMQSLDTIGDTAISWTLGKMVLEASREVPPLSKEVPPLSDPAVGDIIGLTDTPVTSPYDSTSPIRPPIIELYRQDFFPLGFIFYFFALAILFICVYRLRHSMGNIIRRCLRTSGRSYSDNDDHISLEEGYSPNGGRHAALSSPSSVPLPLASTSRHLSSMRSPLSRMPALVRPHSTTPPSSSTTTTRHVKSPGARSSPTRSFSSPALKNLDGSGGYMQYAGAYSGLSTLPPRSSTPPASRRDATHFTGQTNQSLYSLPRSRNSSQLNLTTLIPRQPLSRGGSSGQQTPTGTFHDGD